LATAVLVALLQLLAPAAGAATLTSISLAQSAPEPGATGNTATLTFSSQSTTPVACVTVRFNTQPDGGGTAPSGLSAAATTLSGSFMSSWTGWSTGSSASTAKATRSSAVAPQAGSSRQIVVSNLTNGSTASTGYYALVDTYSDTACTTAVDHGYTSFLWGDDMTVSATVDPALTFTVTGKNTGSCNGVAVTGTGTTPTAVSLGRVDKSSTAVGAQDLAVTTNAANGFSVYARLSGPLADGNGHSIATLPAADSSPVPFPSPGTEAFGFTTDSTTLSGPSPARFSGGKWAGISTADIEVAHAVGTQSATDCIAYGITISKDTVGGYYGTNVVYTAVPSF